MLQAHDFKYFLHLEMRELTLGNEVTDAHRQHMYTLAGKLPDLGQQFIPEGPEMLKSSLDLIVVPIASRATWGAFILSSVMVLLSMRD